MLFPIIKTVSLTLLASYALADASAVQSAQETKAFYESQKALYGSLAEDFAKEINQNTERLGLSVTDDKQVAAEIVGNANSYNTDERRQGMFEKGSIVGGISNQVFAKAEEARRLELNLKKDDQLYIFISRSMPIELIRSYALDAAYSGAVLVMRGLDKGERLGEYLRSEFMQSIKPDGAGAMVQIDPRLFDAFDISLVPSFVYTEATLADLCNDSKSSSTKCSGLKESEYYKISGGITTKFALEQMIEQGAVGAKRHLEHLKSEATSDPENPNLAGAMSSETYRNLVMQIQTRQEESDSRFVFEKNTNILKTQKLQTPFGQVDAPIGVSQIIKNIGSMEVVHEN